VAGCESLCKEVQTFRRQTLQTRFFETGDNFYLGMELNREYDRWKKALAEEIMAPVSMKKMSERKQLQAKQLKHSIMHHLDRLFYSACLRVIKDGDVFNPGARYRVPDLHLIDSYFDVELKTLPAGESFRLCQDPSILFEILLQVPSRVIVRDFEGVIHEMDKRTRVRRESNLTRSPDGNQESRVSLATFPVGHYVNYRTMRKSDTEGYLFCFVGDGQSTPHFMRYSGLTGAAINAMCFENFLRVAIGGVDFQERLKTFASETNWSNGEVVQRGTGTNYGDDGFLRPSFSYHAGIDYLHSKVIEHSESFQDMEHVLSEDWKIKFAASIVPRGMELNDAFQSALLVQLERTILDKIISEAEKDPLIKGTGLTSGLRKLCETANTNTFKWNNLLSNFRKEDVPKIEPHLQIGGRLSFICSQVLDTAAKLHLYNKRYSSELSNQPKPVDWVSMFALQIIYIS
jgi:hypothetical protein